MGDVDIGERRTVMGDVTLGEFDGVQFWHRDDATLVYTAAHMGDGDYQLAWINGDGGVERSGGYPHAYLRDCFAVGTWIRVDTHGRGGIVGPMGELASLVAEVFAAPSRDDSRRYVDMAVRALRGELFAKAVQAVLISLVGDRISVFPSPNEIMATVDACHAWEYARGQVAPGKRTLNRAETKELTEVAKLAAWARVSMRDASDIGEIVAETYERARSTC
ncbi:hypothetical protein WMF38_56830 [Sorangium sp. So ce118]